MARYISETTPECFYNQDSALPAPPASLSIWFKYGNPGDGSASLCALSEPGGGRRDYFRLIFNNTGSTASNALWAQAGDNTNTSNLAELSNLDLQPGVWYQAVATSDANGGLTVHYSGNSAADTSSTLALDNTTDIVIGEFKVGSTGFQAKRCHLAEMGVWNIELNATEAASLSDGFSPLMVRPDALVAYYPLGGMYTGGDGDALDIVGGYTATEEGNVAETDHPPGIIYPISAGVGKTVALPPSFNPAWAEFASGVYPNAT